ncbi:hypothetical protein [Siphonobacter sp. SORGH_AS_0500]|uniref:hypothetical protein n=1 Tax=Siphonobacter sp. SORGH_AS_0500 TaxID=1864824 RepID=UPI0028639B56|nr:hypothetical protein [Siphonobacter sp. SORGH_AS_0500]MDR6194742.1 hypothetical protein [Siphonobacter sp. SORGH_AS_0500]
MAAPTYAQIMAELADWEANPNKRYITGPRLISLMKQYLNHLTNNGAYDPGTFMQQVVGVIGDFPNRFSSLSTTLYVNQATGNDNNTGTAAAPLKSLTRVSQIVNEKFQRVTVFVIGNYTLSENVGFNVEELYIQMQANCSFTFAKRVYQGGFVGETNFCVMFIGRSICLAGTGSSNIIVENNAGYSSGDLYTWKDNQGVIKAGYNNRLSFYETTVVFCVFNTIQIGNNASLVTGMKGLNYLDEKPRFTVDFQYINSYQQGTNSFINPFARRGIFRKSILFNNSAAWKTVADQTELNLETGTYALRLLLSTSGNGGSIFAGVFSGVFSWYGDVAGDSNSTPAEITLHSMAHNLNSKTIRLRTINTPNGVPQRIEALLNETLSSACLLQFSFTKLD